MAPTRDEVRILVEEMLARSSQPQAGTASQAPLPAFDESTKDIITEEDLRVVPQGAQVKVRENCRVTPLAEEFARQRNITLVRTRSPRERLKRRIAIGSDHGGFEMKERLKLFLTQQGYAFTDFGTNSGAAVDYPDYALAVGKAVSSGQYELGILIDSAGIGSCMAANKVPGVRAAMCLDEATARNSREHNDANVLTLGARMIDEMRMREIAYTWLQADCTEPRHKQRVEKIKAIERMYLR